ncbi:hypothetical protein PR048_031592 [Dryococelus australis]|uniref:Uncharacterized protein n=1 Tax=Dryococelus australis TaxID=614101 RepID=A0ABQ9G5P3_9NEOP|nr:hypothetical protein PR048_031592 [Dryococelus australis]
MMSVYTRQKANSKCRNHMRLERASQKQSSDAHKTPYDPVKRCRERKNKHQGVRARQQARYRRLDCTPVQCFARRGEEKVGVHISVAPSAPALLSLRCAKFLQESGHLEDVFTKKEVAAELGAQGNECQPDAAPLSTSDRGADDCPPGQGVSAARAHDVLFACPGPTVGKQTLSCLVARSPPSAFVDQLHPEPSHLRKQGARDGALLPSLFALPRGQMLPPPPLLPNHPQTRARMASRCVFVCCVRNVMTKPCLSSVSPCPWPSPPPPFPSRCRGRPTTRGEMLGVFSIPGISNRLTENFSNQDLKKISLLLRSDSVVTLLASHLGGPRTIPRRSGLRIFECGNRAERCRWLRVFSGISRFLRPCISALLHSHLALPSSALTRNASLLRTDKGQLEYRRGLPLVQSYIRPSRARSFVSGKRGGGGVGAERYLLGRGRPSVGSIVLSRGLHLHALQELLPPRLLSTHALTHGPGPKPTSCLPRPPSTGATVAERLACSPPTKAIRVQSTARSLRIFACGIRAGRYRWLAAFLGVSRLPRPFILISITLLYAHPPHFLLAMHSANVVNGLQSMLVESACRLQPTQVVHEFDTTITEVHRTLNSYTA